jgi:hypothetical protein
MGLLPIKPAEVLLSYTGLDSGRRISSNPGKRGREDQSKGLD